MGDKDSRSGLLNELNDEMLLLSKAERRGRWKYYLAKVTSLDQQTSIVDRDHKYRLFAENALRDAATAPLEIRDDCLLVAKLWKQLADQSDGKH